MEIEKRKGLFVLIRCQLAHAPLFECVMFTASLLAFDCRRVKQKLVDRAVSTVSILKVRSCPESYRGRETGELKGKDPEFVECKNVSSARGVLCVISDSLYDGVS